VHASRLNIIVQKPTSGSSRLDQEQRVHNQNRRVENHDRRVQDQDRRVQDQTKTKEFRPRPEDSPMNPDPIV